MSSLMAWVVTPSQPRPAANVGAAAIASSAVASSQCENFERMVFLLMGLAERAALRYSRGPG